MIEPSNPSPDQSDSSHSGGNKKPPRSENGSGRESSSKNRHQARHPSRRNHRARRLLYVCRSLLEIKLFETTCTILRRVLQKRRKHYCMPTLLGRQIQVLPDRQNRRQKQRKKHPEQERVLANDCWSRWNDVTQTSGSSFQFSVQDRAETRNGHGHPDDESDKFNVLSSFVEFVVVNGIGRMTKIKQVQIQVALKEADRAQMFSFSRIRQPSRLVRDSQTDLFRCVMWSSLKQMPDSRWRMPILACQCYLTLFVSQKRC